MQKEKKGGIISLGKIEWRQKNLTTKLKTSVEDEPRKQDTEENRISEVEDKCNLPRTQ